MRDCVILWSRYILCHPYGLCVPRASVFLLALYPCGLCVSSGAWCHLTVTVFLWALCSCVLCAPMGSVFLWALCSNGFCVPVDCEFRWARGVLCHPYGLCVPKTSVFLWALCSCALCVPMSSRCWLPNYGRCVPMGSVFLWALCPNRLRVQLLFWAFLLGSTRRVLIRTHGEGSNGSSTLVELFHGSVPQEKEGSGLCKAGFSMIFFNLQRSNDNETI